MDSLFLRPTVIQYDRWARWALLATATLVTVLCGLLVVRRVTGDLNHPLSGGGLTFVTCVALLVSAAYRRAWLLATRGVGDRSRATIGFVLPSICVVLLAAALTVPQTPVWALFFSWIAVLVNETAWWTPNAYIRGSRRVGALQRSSSSPEMVEVADQVEGPALPDGVTQQLTRAADPETGETMYGLVRAHFGPNEVLQQVHVAFCPPFPKKPQAQAFVVSGPSVNLRVAQLESFGLRFELRRQSAPLHADEVVVEFEVKCGSEV